MEAELLYQRGVPPQATYLFKHALIQETAYQSLLKSTRQQYHQRIAHVLETRFPETAETQPALLAHHYTEGGLTEQAILYWQRAGEHASNRSANLEAVSHFTTGVKLLTTLPETPERTQHALTLHIALGAALRMAKGYAAPEVEQAYTQAYALCQQVGETLQLAPALLGLCGFYLVRPQLHRARELGETLLWLGALSTARMHLEADIMRFTPDQRCALMFRTGQDLGVSYQVYTAMTLELLGYPDQALACLQAAIALAHELSHPFSLAFARCRVASVYQLRRDVLAVHEHAEAAVALAAEQGFPFLLVMGTSLRGWALAEAHALVEQHEERYWEAEVCRLRGVLLLSQALTPTEEAETWLWRALDIARRQEAKALELRAAMSLARLWRLQGKRTEAYELLASVYGWFTEGFDTIDLQEAKVLLEELA